MSRNTKKKSDKERAKSASSRRDSHRSGRNSKGPKIAASVEGVVSMNRDGLGFVTVPEMTESIFIPVSKMRGALNGDYVRVNVLRRRRPQSGKIEGEIACVLQRSRKPHIGILVVRKRDVWAIVESRVMPYDIRIMCEPENLPTIGGLKAENGDKVAVLVKDWPKSSAEPLGVIVDVLGTPGENDTEMHSILAEYNLPYRFEPEVENAAESISELITDKDIAARKDFRGVTTFTIDPSDAKDFDDALSYRKLDNGNYEVGIHIADVTHYVQPGSPVDREAFDRGTSVYLVDRTIPMLPEKLCNNLCSLRQDEDKLTYSVILEMTDAGVVKRSRIARTVIRSNRRFAYEEVQAIIEREQQGGKEKLPGDEFKTEIMTLDSLAKILRAKRFQEGALSFDRVEVRFEIDETGHPVSVFFKESKDANQLVEEFMLLANRTVAEFIGKVKGGNPKTFVYRVHDEPDPERMENLQNFVAKFGYKLKTNGDPAEMAKSMNKMLQEVKGKKEQELIETISIRSMQKACYTTENIGHYGLAFKFYTHFTSPIRRYPDLMVHRLLTRYIGGGRSVNQGRYEEYCEHCSAQEQLAEQAERSSIKYKQVEYMSDRMGQVFDAVISGVTEWGIYAEIIENKCEGMIGIRSLGGDYFEFDEKNYCITGQRTRKRYRLGDHVKVKVVRCNLEKKQMDYELVSTEE